MPRLGLPISPGFVASQTERETRPSDVSWEGVVATPGANRQRRRPMFDWLLFVLLAGAIIAAAMCIDALS